MSRKTLNFQLLWMVFFNALCASALSFVSLHETLQYDFSTASAYLILQQIGHFQFFAFILALPLIVIALLIPQRYLIQTLASVWFGFFILMVYIDYSIFQLYKFHINGMVWNMLTGGAFNEIFVFDVSNILTLSFVLFIILGAQWLLFSFTKRLANSDKTRGYYVFAVVISLQVSGQLMYAVANAQYNINIMSLTRFVPLAQPLTMDRYLYENDWVKKPDYKQVKTQTSGRFNYPINPMKCLKKDNPPNIIFIVIDSLRFDMIDKEIMPNWYQLSKEAQVFNHHLSTGNATRFGLFGLFSGLFGNYWFDALNSKMKPVFISELLNNNYEFKFFPSARLTSPEFDRAIFSQVSNSIPVKTEGKSVIDRDYKITQQATDYFSSQPQKPFFSFIFYDAPHAYTYPKQDAKFSPTDSGINYLKLKNSSDRQSFLNRYKNAVHFSDRLSGELINTLKETQLINNSIVILTGDHGKEANETNTNSWGHNSNFSKYQAQVPLLIYWPNKAPQEFNHLSSHADVVPTLMEELFSCSNPTSDYSSGQNLFNSQERDFILINNWTNQALSNKQFTREFHKIRSPINYDAKDYSELDNKQEYSRFDAEALNKNSWFYKP